MTKMTEPVLPIHTAEFARVPGNVTINDLPDELIIYIARFITLGTNAAALSAPDMCANNLALFRLTLCSQHFHSIVEPVLYERFHDGFGGSEKRLQRFLQRLLVRPDLARCVRFIHWEKILGCSLAVDCFGVEGWKEARDRIMVLHENPTERDAWNETVEELGLEAIVALLFVLTPNVEELALHSHGLIDSVPPALRWMSPQIRRLQLQKQLENPAALWNLRSVNVNLWPTDGEDPNHLMQLITIPSVEIFRASSLDETVLVDFLDANDLVLDNIKELTLSSDRIDPDILRQFLCRFPSLKRLYCSMNGADDSEIYPPDLAFMPHFLEPELEDLAITDSVTLTNNGILIPRKLKSLTPFKNLRILKTTWAQLVGQIDTGGDLSDELFGKDIPETSRKMADVIPTSLERLTLRGHCNSAPAVMSEFFSQKHRFPSLKYMDLGWMCYFYSDKSKPDDPHFHINFSEAEALECLSMWREAGVEIGMWTQRRERKAVTHPAMDEQGNATGETL